MKLRHQFVLRALEPDANISELCREYGISRKTGYKWIGRFKERGVPGLVDMSRRPKSNPLRADGEAVMRVIELRRAHPRWGARKLHAILARELDGCRVPSVRTIGRVLERAGLVRRRRKKLRNAVPLTCPTPNVHGPNDLWTVDFKGWWLTKDRQRAEPLTVRDAYSRFVLCAELLESTRLEAVRETFEQLFEKYGLPKAILVDNGAPFIAVRSRGGLTRLSAWWVAMGIRLYRGRPGHPQDNGGHERMHLDLRYEVEDVPADDLAGQQHALERWREEFNCVRPHESLDMRVPADVFKRSARRVRPPKRPFYPPNYQRRTADCHGQLKFHGEKLTIGRAVGGYDIGLRRTGDGRVHVRFYDVDLGYIEFQPCAPAT